MPVVYPDQRVAPVAQLLMTCLAQAALDNPKPPGVVGFRTGTEGQPLAAQTADECCQGAAFVRVVRTFSSWGTPAPATASIRCAQPTAVEMELSMWRCAPIGTMQVLPAQPMWDELHADLLNDRATLVAALCCFWAQRDQGSVAYGDWQAVSAEGGCAGGTITLTADLYGRGN